MFRDGHGDNIFHFRGVFSFFSIALLCKKSLKNSSKVKRIQEQFLPKMFAILMREKRRPITISHERLQRKELSSINFSSQFSASCQQHKAKLENTSKQQINRCPFNTNISFLQSDFRVALNLHNQRETIHIIISANTLNNKTLSPKPSDRTILKPKCVEGTSEPSWNETIRKRSGERTTNV